MHWAGNPQNLSTIHPLPSRIDTFKAKNVISLRRKSKVVYVPSQFDVANVYIWNFWITLQLV